MNETSPRLVDLSKIKITKVPHVPMVHNKIKWNINKILLVGFTIFTIFFLYNCRYGMFRSNGYLNS